MKKSACGASLTPQDVLTALYKEHFGETPRVIALAGAGSDRKYFRLSAPGVSPAVGTWGADAAENRCFVALSRVFGNAGCKVPEVYCVSEDCGAYLQEDLGDEALLRRLGGEDRLRLAERCLHALVEMQTVAEEKWSGVVAMPEFSLRQVMWDLNYFKYEFLKPSGISFDENRLEDDFEALGKTLAGTDRRTWGFMFRDFQSRNIMMCGEEPYFIDYQGGRKGPLIYDAVSFLWQAKAGFAEGERKDLLGCYAGRLAAVRGLDSGEVMKDAGVMALFRTLQVLGAYGLRGLVEKRAHFIESIPGAIANLSQLRREGVLAAYPELEEVARRISESRFAGSVRQEGLTVKVFSFSYKKGYPEDLTGNGGGFMFDCRGMHNPGRYDEYKALTGLDAPVRAFLEERGEVQEFVENAFRMTSPSVDRYAARGFSSLQIGFGCTGGRHRSVYCAQALAERIAASFPGVRVVVCHREQGIERRFNFHCSGK